MVVCFLLPSHAVVLDSTSTLHRLKNYSSNCEGVCVMTPGPCDQNQKGCCVNTATGARYCATRDEGRLACDIASEQDGDSGLSCEYCGYENQPCCFPSSLDAQIATPWEVAMTPSICAEQAADTLGCMLDQGSADHFNRCDMRFFQ